MGRIPFIVSPPGSLQTAPGVQGDALVTVTVYVLVSVMSAESTASTLPVRTDDALGRLPRPQRLGRYVRDREEVFVLQKYPAVERADNIDRPAPRYLESIRVLVARLG